jgi:3',5'-nucleoside bisphosphate phosphatase
MIDLHLHTTASDGRCTPEELVRRAREAGITTLAVTDHDTVVAIAESAQLAAAAGIGFVTGIEISARRHGTDVHVLGYFIDPVSPDLQRFLAAQRADRLRRVRAIGDRLADLMVPVDMDCLVMRAEAEPQRAIGRLHVARAMVRAGHVPDVREAFDRFLGEGRPAYVPRRGASPAEVIRLIADAGGLASLAHPGLLGHDEWIGELMAAGLQAIEVYHGEHSPGMTGHYRALAQDLGLAVTGGSDYHAEPTHGAASLGLVQLPAEDFDRLSRLARARQAAAGTRALAGREQRG